MHSLGIASMGKGGESENTLSRLSPFLTEPSCERNKLMRVAGESLARALNVAVSHRSLPLGDADREAF